MKEAGHNAPKQTISLKHKTAKQGDLGPGPGAYDTTKSPRGRRAPSHHIQGRYKRMSHENRAPGINP